MSGQESSSEETITDTSTSQIWNGTSTKITNTKKAILKTFFIKIETENKN